MSVMLSADCKIMIPLRSTAAAAMDLQDFMHALKLQDFGISGSQSSLGRSSLLSREAEGSGMSCV